MIDWSTCSAVEQDPARVSGAWVFRGTRVPVAAQERGWSGLKNGELIAAAEAAGFAVFITTDQNLKYQQNLGARKLALVVLSRVTEMKAQYDLSKMKSRRNPYAAKLINRVRTDRR